MDGKRKGEKRKKNQSFEKKLLKDFRRKLKLSGSSYILFIDRYSNAEVCPYAQCTLSALLH